MKLNATRHFFAGAVLILTSLIPALLTAQTPTASLSGRVTDPSGQVVSTAKVTVRNLETGQSAETRSNPDGVYTFSNLAPGTYTLSISADAFAAKTSQVTLTAAQQTLDLMLAPAPVPEALPNAPSAIPASPSLGDLGFSPQQSQPNAQLQALLDKRTEMLKIHQRLGLITTIPMAAALITGPMVAAKGKNGQPITEPTSANLDFHAALGGTTTALYFTSAYYAIRAPRVPGTEKHGAIRVHEALAFVHLPGMILTPALGMMAYKQENAGEKVHGVASAHGAVAFTTAAAYGASIIAVSWPIHWKFWEKQ
ncbi:MAG: carboxypeptidase-like regulatory domain-containing protein [Terracidiphilus sp.]|jgi:hypothetical protein